MKPAEARVQSQDCVGFVEDNVVLVLVFLLVLYHSTSAPYHSSARIADVV